MQTFLPFPDFPRSAAVLDRARLARQRVDAWRLLEGLVTERLGVTPPDPSPVAALWRGRDWWLCQYGLECSLEQARRGFVDTMAPRFVQEGGRFLPGPPPAWLGDMAFHRSHQALLLAKDFDHYAPLFPGVSPVQPVAWPKAHMTFPSKAAGAIAGHIQGAPR